MRVPARVIGINNSTRSSIETSNDRLIVHVTTVRLELPSKRFRLEGSSRRRPQQQPATPAAAAATSPDSSPRKSRRRNNPSQSTRPARRPSGSPLRQTRSRPGQMRSMRGGLLLRPRMPDSPRQGTRESVCCDRGGQGSACAPGADCQGRAGGGQGQGGGRGGGRPVRDLPVDACECG